MRKKTLFLSTTLLAVASGGAFAADVAAPPEIVAAVPSGAHLVAFKKSGDQMGADAVAVYETTADASGSRNRELLVFRKQNGAFQEVVRSDRIVACSTCSPERSDPFVSADQIKVTPGHIDIRQSYGDAHPTDVTFAFAYDKGQWRVTSASSQDGAGKVTRIPLPSSGLLKDFDGGWQRKSFWNALMLNDVKHSFRFLLAQPSESALAGKIDDTRKESGDWHVAARVADGCIALARDASGTFFPVAKPGTSSKDQASQEAMAACKAQGKGECEAVRTSCSAGPI
ncbi:DUF4189 domain-containing protein [Luteibacter aegosomatis]|uniref:DUF4189 domain-containing protein n=1 Tax=Luteibacter aegosomatis TaxID=2911537 RepID=UPI001FFBB929|nr:DUF4189 domain-containing protein [Luteibacter aegosomatis]UPG84676.1 DUF4189 domain-containing protein [Luteibacter aegosomatis]